MIDLTPENVRFLELIGQPVPQADTSAPSAAPSAAPSNTEGE